MKPLSRLLPAVLVLALTSACGSSGADRTGAGATSTGSAAGTSGGTGGGASTGSGSSFGGSSGTGTPIPECGAGSHLAFDKSVDLPGRGMALAWAPDGKRIATGGHFKDPATGLRYDTKVYDALAATYDRSFDCHNYWVIGLAWQNNAFIGDAIATGGYDHAIKLWNAAGPGSTTCNPGQFVAEEGALDKLPEINGATTAIAYSPDGRFLAAANRDRAIRIWQLEPGPNALKVVSLWYEEAAGNLLSIAWAPDGKRLVTGDKQLGRVAVWSFDPATDLWDDARIQAFAAVGFEAQPGYFTQHTAELTRTPLWQEAGHEAVWNARFSPDGAAVAAAASDGTLSVYDAANGTVHFSAEAPGKPELHGLDWSPGGEFVVAGGSDAGIYVFDAKTGAPYDTLTGSADLVTAVAWSPDGCTLATTAGGKRVSTLNEIHDVVDGPDMTVRFWRYP